MLRPVTARHRQHRRGRRLRAKRLTDEERFGLFLELLRFYARRTGHARPPALHREGNFPLGSWVVEARGQYRGGVLSPERAHILEALRGWSWDPLGDEFQRHVRALLQFVRREGHVRIPSRHQEDGILLGTWAVGQRALYKRGGLPKERVRALERVPGWSWRPRADRQQLALSALRRFVRREGHALVPQTYREGSFGLGHWVQKMRQLRREGRLPPSQARLLERIRGWSWSPVRDRFPQRLTFVRRFAQRHGHALIPAAHVAGGGVAVGAWVVQQRRLYRSKRLPPDRVRALERVPGWSWDPKEDDFRRVLALLQRFARREGHACPPSGWREDRVDLGTWVQVRRMERRRGRLSPERKRLLESLPGWSWDPLEDRFQRGLALLRRFARQEGHARVPGDTWEDGFPLGMWVEVRRMQYRKGRLSKERRRLLEAVPGWSWRVRGAPSRPRPPRS